ncbi:sensor histidine kinase [Idiomarina ramblicola]|nr:PAS domain-containing sensor histidine kinase [Idiomarina ramblicola]
MEYSWLRLVARSYWRSLTLACLLWGSIGCFVISVGLVSVSFRMSLVDALFSFGVGALGAVLLYHRRLRLLINRQQALCWLVALACFLLSGWQLYFAFQTDLYIFPGVLAAVTGTGLICLPFFTVSNSQKNDGNGLWIMLLLYILAGIWWLYALNQPLHGMSILQNSVPGIILVGHFVMLTLLYISRDVILDFHELTTQRDKALEGLHRSEQHYRSLFDHNPNAAFSLDLSGRFTDLNKSGETFLERKKDKVIGQHYENVLVSNELPRVALFFDKALKGEPMHYETIIQRHSGERLNLSVSNIPMQEDGKVVGVFGIAQDITAIKQTYHELEQVNDELENFATVASHDLQEPLRKIVSFGELLKQSHLKEQERDYLERMVSASRRMQQLIAEVLELAKLGRDSLQLEPVDLQKIASQVLGEHQAKLSAMGAQVEINLRHELTADAKLLARVFENLLTNAMKYARKDRKLKIELNSSSTAADRVTIACSDNGIGIEATYHQAVFRPFKRLHSRSEVSGTGMGLAIIKKIVDLHHGEVSLTSHIGQGSTFKLVLPK